MPKHTHIQKMRVEDMRPKDALVVGLAQILALIPGTLRFQGSTHYGRYVVGAGAQSRHRIFVFLAVPVMIAATFYDVIKHYKDFSLQDAMLIVVGFVAAFMAGLYGKSLAQIYRHQKRHVPFAWYRIVFGGVILLTWLTGWV